MRGFPRAKSLRKRACFGFTFIEILIVMSIASVLSTILLTYSKTGERQIVLLRDQSRIQTFLVRAKSLALATYGESSPACGYGVHVEEPRSVVLYADLSEDCEASSHDYVGPLARVESFELDKRLLLDNPAVRDIFFLPPDPDVLFIPDAEEASIVIKTQGSSAQGSIHVTKAGQITTE